MNLGLAFVQTDGNLGISLQTPISDSTSGYAGPKWNTGIEFQAGPELALSGPAYDDVQGFLSHIGVSLNVNTNWALFDDKLDLLASPSPVVSASGTATVGQAVTLTAIVPAGFNGATVQFEGYVNQSSSGTALGTATVSGLRATLSWTPKLSGSYQVGALLFDSVFGPLGLPYVSANPLTIAVSGTGSTTTTTATTTTTTQPTTTTTVPAAAVIVGQNTLGGTTLGQSQSDALAALEAQLGPADLLSSSICGGSQPVTVAQWDDLSVIFISGAMDGFDYNYGGWSAAQHTANPAAPPPGSALSPDVKTATGATIGETVAQVQAQDPAANIPPTGYGGVPRVPNRR